MKKFILVLVLVGAFITAEAQPRAIGVRVGGDSEFSYQHGFGSTNMLDCTFGVSGYAYHFFGIQATVVYDWIFNINGGWNWYVGPGGGVGVGFGGLGLYSSYYTTSVLLAVNVGGQIGVEYQFGIPLNLSLDYRPMFNTLGFLNGYWANWASFDLGIRYRF